MKNKKLFKKERIEYLFDKFERFIDYDKQYDINDIKKDKDKYFDFLIEVLNLLSQNEKIKEKPELINKFFSNKEIEEICFKCENKSNILTNKLNYRLNNDIDFLKAISLSPWHSFSDEKLDYNQTKDIYEKLNNLPNIKDKRFYSKAVFTNAFGMINKFVGGVIDKDCLKYENVGYKKVNDEIVKIEPMENSYFIDGKLGFMIYFKKKPSILVSFNLDDKKNIYIKQIQSQLKSRGHYSLGENWREVIVNYVSESFPEYKINLIKGKELVEDIGIQYKQSANLTKPSEITYKHIIESYDKIYKDKKKTTKSGYRLIRN